MKVIKTIKDKILFAYQLVAAITLVVLIAAAAIQVVTRYVIAQPPGWTDELARFAFVWCSALGAVVALDKGMHAGITLLEEKLPEAGRRVLKIICTILVIAMAALVGVKGVSLVSVTVTVLSPSLHLSVSKMFIGGVLPGIMMAIALCLVNVYLAAKYKFAKSDVRYPKKEVLRRTARAIPTLVLPVIILGGIYGGLVTPTEAAVLSVLYALIYGFATKEIKVKVLWTVLSKTVLTSAVVTFIISVAKTFGWILSKTRLPAIIGEAIMEVIPNKWVYLAVLMALLFLVGCLMDTIPSILILAPILVPVGVQFGLDELHLGVLFCITLTVGFITPPFGINLFTAVSTTGESYTSVVKGVIPFMIVMIICVLICAFVSPIITFLPGFMMGT